MNLFKKKNKQNIINIDQLTTNQLKEEQLQTNIPTTNQEIPQVQIKTEDIQLKQKRRGMNVEQKTYKKMKKEEELDQEGNQESDIITANKDNLQALNIEIGIQKPDWKINRKRKLLNLFSVSFYAEIEDMPIKLAPNPVNTLYELPENLKLKNEMIEESYETTNWVTGITEVPLSLWHKLDNIEQTEQTKRSAIHDINVGLSNYQNLHQEEYEEMQQWRKKVNLQEKKDTKYLKKVVPQGRLAKKLKEIRRQINLSQEAKLQNLSKKND